MLVTAKATIRTLCMLTGLLITSVSLVHAQNIPIPKKSGTSASSVKLNIEYDQSLGTAFYVDMIGLASAENPFAPEELIDESTYRLGPTDLIGVVITGSLTLNYRAIGVNMEGEIILPSIGTIPVAGLTLMEARQRIRKEVEKEFRNVSISVSIDKPRPLSVHLYGDIPYPGRVSTTYGTRLDNPLLRSLFEVRGPDTEVASGTSVTKILYPSFLDLPGLTERVDDLGNAIIAKPLTSVGKLLNDRKWQLRSIEILRADGSVLYADMYRYFYGGDLDGNPSLLDGDQIKIMSSREADPRVSISGAVNNPMEIPYRNDDTFGLLLKIGGGYMANADTTSYTIFRPGKEGITRIQVTRDQADFYSKKLLPNDRIIIGKSELDANLYSATVVGQVDAMGIYPIREGKTTAYDLLEMTGGVDPTALKKAAYIVRSKLPVVDEPSLMKSGFRDVMRGSDQMVQGLSWLELEQRARKNRIYLDLNQVNQLKSTYIMDRDSLIVPRDMGTVYVYGQVEKPGFVNHQPGASLNYYLNSAGGYALASDPKRVYVIKAGTLAWSEANDTKIESGDMVYVDRIMLDDNLQRRSFMRQSQSLYTTIVLSVISTTLTVINFFRN